MSRSVFRASTDAQETLGATGSDRKQQEATGSLAVCSPSTNLGGGHVVEVGQLEQCGVGRVQVDQDRRGGVYVPAMELNKFVVPLENDAHLGQG